VCTFIKFLGYIHRFKESGNEGCKEKAPMGEMVNITAPLRATIFSFLTDLKPNIETSVTMYKITRCHNPDQPESQTIPSCTGLLGFLDFSIIRYSKRLENTTFRKLDLFPSSDKMGE
jgi:hypothetical protein